MKTDYKMQFEVNKDGELHFITPEKYQSLNTNKISIIAEANSKITVIRHDSKGIYSILPYNVEYYELRDFFQNSIPEIDSWPAQRLVAFTWGEDNVEIDLAINA